MADVQTYLDGLADRLASDGCAVTSERWGTHDVLIGHRSDFRIQWIATNLHLLTIAAPAEVITLPDIENFTRAAWDQALARKGQMRGLQTGLALFPTLVGTQVTPDAAAWAAAEQRKRFAAFARPVVVDATGPQVNAFTGRVTFGGIYNSHLIGKLRAYFPGVA